MNEESGVAIAEVKWIPPVIIKWIEEDEERWNTAGLELIECIKSMGEFSDELSRTDTSTG